MISSQLLRRGLAAVLLAAFTLPAGAQSFEIQCPESGTSLHSADTSPPYTGPTAQTKTITRADGSTYTVSYVDNGGGIKCQQLSGGDGFATMADGTQTYLFAFGPLSGLQSIKQGLPGTQLATQFLQPYHADPAHPNDPDFATNPNGAVGLEPQTDADGFFSPGHADPRPIMDVGVLNGNIPAPMIAIDEDDELFLTLTNVGQIMRPDLFEQHTVHFHGYPNASSFYDGVPDASVAINIGGSFTYYYLAPEAGTYIWHCHITPPEHLQMGMVGQLYVRPRQNRVPVGTSLLTSLQLQQTDKRTMCGSDVLCATPLPANDTGAQQAIDPRTLKPQMYAYNDGDGSTAYDVEYPIQIHGFDPDFHFVGMTFNPENFTDSKNKYFLLNGRSYPDTIKEGALSTQVADGTDHFSQPLPTIINIPVGGKALLRFSDLETNEFQTLASLGIPMHVIGLNARLLRDLAGNDTSYYTNSITMGGGESIDVILDASDTSKYQAGQTYYLYTPNLDHLSNDAENFGGLMTEVHICATVDPDTKTCGN